jgi:hypothetical protein
MIMKDRIYLQHLWSFLSRQMAIIANNIKNEAQIQFDKDMREHPSFVHSGLSAAQNIINNPNRSTKKTARGLIELTGDSLIFAKVNKKLINHLIIYFLFEIKFNFQIQIHMWFTYVLRMSTCQISEEFIHGPLSEGNLTIKFKYLK